MWTEARYALASALMICSLFTLFTGVLGTYRFRDSLQKMHAAGVNDTLGFFLAVSSLILAEGFSFTSFKFILVMIFLWISSPVSTHLLAQLELARRTARNMEEKT